MSDKLSIREFINTGKLILSGKEYHNYDIDCKVNLKKDYLQTI